MRNIVSAGKDVKPQDHLLSIAEAAWLHISVYTLRTWVCWRRIPYIKLGRRVLLRLEDLEGFIKMNLVNPYLGEQEKSEQ